MSTTLTADVLLSAHSASSADSIWILDSGATHHFCNNSSLFVPSSLASCPPVSIRLGDNSTVSASSKGTICLSNSHSVTALLVPVFRFSLFSIPLFDKCGWSTKMSNNCCVVSDTTDTTVILATMQDDLYRWTQDDPTVLVTTRSGRVTSTPTTEAQAPVPTPAPLSEMLPLERPRPDKQTLRVLNRQFHQSQSSNSALTWHRRLGHLHFESLKHLLGNKNISERDMPDHCEPCVLAKQRQSVIRTPTTRSTIPFELVHSDVCGPMSTTSLGKSRYYIVYIDDFTRWVKVYFLNSKSTDCILPVFRKFLAWVNNQGYTVKHLRCDNGTGEFNNQQFRDLLDLAGISFEPAPPYTQHKNGTAERMIQTLNTKARCMLLDSHLPHFLWAEAINTAAYLHSITPSASLPNFKSPLETLRGSSPQIDHLRRFGCLVYKHIPPAQRTDKNWGPRSLPCAMVGYAPNTTKIWRIYDFSTKRICLASSVVFVEDVNAFDSSTLVSSQEHCEIQAALDLLPDPAKDEAEDILMADSGQHTESMFPHVFLFPPSVSLSVLFSALFFSFFLFLRPLSTPRSRV